MVCIAVDIFGMARDVVGSVVVVARETNTVDLLVRVDVVDALGGNLTVVSDEVVSRAGEVCGVVIDEVKFWVVGVGLAEIVVGVDWLVSGVDVAIKASIVLEEVVGLTMVV